jgi:hypothetical protein
MARFDLVIFFDCDGVVVGSERRVLDRCSVLCSSDSLAVPLSTDAEAHRAGRRDFWPLAGRLHGHRRAAQR